MHDSWALDVLCHPEEIRVVRERLRGYRRRVCEKKKGAVTCEQGERRLYNLTTFEAAPERLGRVAMRALLAWNGLGRLARDERGIGMESRKPA